MAAEPDIWPPSGASGRRAGHPAAEPDTWFVAEIQPEAKAKVAGRALAGRALLPHSEGALGEI